MSNIVQSFGFDSSNVRTAQNDDGTTWFCLGDLLNAMQTKTDASSAKASIEEHLGKGTFINLTLQTAGGEQDMLFVSESGMAFVLSRSRTDAGKRLNRFIFNEVLPSIRKTGSYSLPEIAPEPRKLPPIRDTIEYLEASEKIAKLEDPILRSYLMQSLYEDIGATKSLPASIERHAPIAVLARELGYKLKPGQDSALGKWAKKHLAPTGHIPHGRYDVNTYKVDERTAEVISAFFQ